MDGPDGESLKFRLVMLILSVIADQAYIDGYKKHKD